MPPTPPLRLAILTSIMAPHRDGPFATLAADPSIDLTVIYTAPGDPRRAWTTEGRRLDFRHVVLHERARVRRANTYAHFSTGLLPALRSARPEVVVVGGWDQPAYLEALMARRRLGYRFLWWIENNLRDYRFESSSGGTFKRRLIARADGVVVPGSASREYVASLGALPDRVWTAPNAVDGVPYREAAAGRDGHDGPARFLCVARLEPTKGMMTLLDAWAAVRGEAELVLAGFGLLEGPIRARALERVTLLGDVAHSDLPAEYARADAAVLCSVHDAWGLVINEAMASGLPVIASEAAGATDDLVTDGWNGVVVPPMDAAALTRAMETLASDAELRRKMGARSAERISSGFEPVHWAAGMAEAALEASGRAT